MRTADAVRRGRGGTNRAGHGSKQAEKTLQGAFPACFRAAAAARSRPAPCRAAKLRGNKSPLYKTAGFQMYEPVKWTQPISPAPLLMAMNNGANTKETTVISLMRMLMDGPEVSLNGSPTVSPTTAALWLSLPLPP